MVLKPSTLLHLHHVLTKRKYHLLFSSRRGCRPGPKGPAKELIDAVVEIKRRNPTWGCPRIAQQITLAFGVGIDKDVVRRILGKHYRPESGSGGPSWLTFLGQAKDSLWSIDLFRCESLSLRTHWVLVVMDQFTRRIIGFGIHRGTVDGPSLIAMFQQAIQGQSLPKYLSHGQRSVVSVPPMAGQPSSIRGIGDQDGTLRAAIASLCGATCWNPKERVPGSNLILDDGRPGGEAARVSKVF